MLQFVPSSLKHIGIFQDCIEVHVRSTKGPIDVYICEVSLDNPDIKASENTDQLSCERKQADLLEVNTILEDRKIKVLKAE